MGKLWIGFLILLTVKAVKAEIPERAPPSKGEIIALVAVESLIVIDMFQTLKFTHNSSMSYEVNPLLGKHPSSLRIVGTACTGALLTATLWYVTPPKLRYIVVGVIGAGELLAVANNVFYAKVGFGF